MNRKTSTPTPRLERIKRVSVVDSVTERLVAYITGGHLRPGDKLPSEYELMEQLQVGRSSVREAIRGLALVGIVESRPRRGMIVTSPVSNVRGKELKWPLTFWALKDLFAVRLILEGYAAQEAARWATPDDIDRIAAAATALERKIGKGQVYFRENAAFHLEIAKASRNQVLLNCLNMIIGGLRDLREPVDLEMPGTPIVDIRDHNFILRAIQEHRPDQARKLMEAHLKSTIEKLDPSHSKKSQKPKTQRDIKV
jgi:GntR family transcriptional regulator, transcriptional repressor for pyruvate dehydrogenase complex